MTTQIGRGLVFLASLFVAFGCADHVSNKASNVSILRPIGESFRVGLDMVSPGLNLGESAPLRVTDRKTLTINRKALDSLFLLQAETIQQPQVAFAFGLKSRIVIFHSDVDSNLPDEKFLNQKIYLAEAVEGNTVTRDLPQTLLLAEFKILEAKEGWLTFDFNAGMSNIFSAVEWRAQEDGSAYKPSYSSIKTRISYLGNIRITANNHLEIRQIAQVGKDGIGTSDSSSVEIRYYLSPYQKDPSFKTSVSRDLERTGFFAVASYLKEGGATVVHATKFGSEKIFAISSNTPPEYRDAVRDGILYWNQATQFKDSPVQVVDAPKGRTAPDIEYNIIQWVPWDRAGYAYADAQADPWTGKTLHGQAFVTSVFAFHSKSQARAALRRLKASNAEKAGLSIKQQLSLAGFEIPPTCDLDLSRQMEGALTGLLAGNPDDPTVLRVSQDMIRAVVAHEVGHILGLRHNFAGSLGAVNYPLSEREKIFKEYVEKGTLPPALAVTSSVMDYLRFEEDVMLGRHIANHGNLMAHDDKAISILYGSKTFGRQEIPLFCTDSHVGRYVDCRRFDAGASAVEYAAWETKQQLESLPTTLAEKFLDAKLPQEGGETTPVDEVTFELDRLAADIIATRGAVVREATGKLGYLKIQRGFPVIGDLNIDKAILAEKRYSEEEILRFGGLERVFLLVTASDISSVLSKVIPLLQSASYRSVTGSDGREFQLSNEELRSIGETLGLLGEKLPSVLGKADLAILSKVPNYWKSTASPLAEPLQILMSKRVQEYVLSQDAKETIEAEVELPSVETTGTPEKVKLTLPKFTYHVFVRESASKLLSQSLEVDSLDWATKEREEQKQKLVQLLKSQLAGRDIQKLKATELKIVPNQMRKQVVNWIQDNQKVLRAF